MDLALSVKPAISNKHGLILDIAICAIRRLADGNRHMNRYDFSMFFDESFKVAREEKDGISYNIDKLKTFHENIYAMVEYYNFRDKVEEIKSILQNNRVIIFNDEFDARQLLIQQCKNEGIDYQWVDELKIECCKEKAESFYKPIKKLDLETAVTLSRCENTAPKLNVPEPEDFFCFPENYHTAFGDCIRIAFVFSVIKRSLMIRAAA